MTLESWWRQPFRVDECGNRIAAMVLALPSTGAALGLVACVHELFTGATKFSLIEIFLAWFGYLSMFGVVFGLLLGVPYVLFYDRFVGGPRLLFVAGYTVFSAVFGSLVYGWWWVFAIAAVIMSSTFVALLELPPARADP